MYVFLDLHGLCVNLAEIFQECPRVGPKRAKASLESCGILNFRLADMARVTKMSFRLSVKAIVIFMNEEEDANGGEGTRSL